MMNEVKVNELILQSLEHRSDYFKGLKTTNCFRLFHGIYDGIDQLFVDYLAGNLFVSGYEWHFEFIPQIKKSIMDLYSIDIKNIYIQDRDIDSSKRAITLFADNSSNQNLEPLIVKENGLNYLLKFDKGFHYGLFLEQKIIRKDFIQSIEGLKVLNLFCYTSSFSVALGAKNQTVNVDLNKKYLTWSRENFQLNNIDLNGHKFIPEDAITFVNRLHNRSEKFDLILFDPPSFANFNKKRWSTKKDWIPAIRKLFKILAADGKILAIHNLQEWNRQDCYWQLEDFGRQIIVANTSSDFPARENEASFVQSYWLK